jgi:hypothetical protein
MYRVYTKEWCGFNGEYRETAPFFCVYPVDGVTRVTAVCSSTGINKSLYCGISLSEPKVYKVKVSLEQAMKAQRGS